MRGDSMKRIRKICIIIVLLLYPVIKMPSVEAKDDSSNVPVFYTPIKVYKKVKLQVNVKGKGVLLDYQQPIREGQVVYELLEADSKSFTIKADTGYQVAEASYFDGYQKSDLLKRDNTQSITVKLTDKDANLTVTFTKVKPDDNEVPPVVDPIIPPVIDPDIPQPEDPIAPPIIEPDAPPIIKPETPAMVDSTPDTEDTKKAGIVTGDHTEILNIVALMGLTGIIILILRKKKNEKS